MSAVVIFLSYVLYTYTTYTTFIFCAGRRHCDMSNFLLNEYE